MNQTGINRQQIGHWGSILGSTALLVGVLGWLWQGVASPMVLGALLAGVFGVMLWAFMSPKEFRDFISGRQVRYGTVSVFTTLLMIGIIAVVYIIVQRAAITLDMTLARSFSLSGETEQILSGVRRPIRITAFYNAAGLLQREVDDQIFRLYETSTNGLITREYINPDEQPALAQRFGAYANGATFVSYLREDGSVDFDTLARVPRVPGGAQEREMTQAIARLLLAGTYKVYFETGLGTLDPLDTSQQGISGIHLGMQESGLITDALNLPLLAATGGAIPDDAAALILARPTIDLNAAEISVLDAYLQRGGSLFIMADALFSDGAFMRENGLFNTYMWENYGIRTRDAVIVDEGASLRTPLDIVGAAAFVGTDIGQRLDPADAPTLFRLARVVEVNSDNPPVNNGRVLSSSPLSYGETNTAGITERNTYQFDADNDIPGPVDIAVWAWDQATDARILLVGDGDFITNGFVASAIGNALLFTDGTAWLTGMNESIAFTPRAVSVGLPLIFVTTQTLDTIAFFTVILMPALMLVMGLGIWLRRVRR
jgi:hypothetical protein